MIKFEEHDDNLFRMLEEPVPLTDDAELPVLVRLIQDDTMLGKANKRSYHPDTLAKKIICSSSKLTDDGLFMDGNYTYCYEIIGTLVAEGSAEWALYRLMQGDIVMGKYWGDDVIIDSTSSGWHEVIRVVLYGKRRGMPITDDDFLFHAEKDGWQIYTEPKPLLADAKVGDIVKTNLGDYLQIVDTPCLRFEHDGCYRTHDGLYWDECGVCDVDSTYRLVAVEPLAPEGTKEWAWQMMLLGKIIIHSEYSHENATWKMNNGTARSCLAGMSACSKEQWVANAIDNGWQLYKEPKPTFKVGDWVEFIDAGGHKLQGKYLSNAYDNAILVRDTTYNMRCVVPVTKIIRKLSLSELIIKIGCLSGTIQHCLFFDNDGEKHDAIKIFNSNGKSIAIIQLEALNTETRSLVESLLKAQKEEKGE
jgi:hypothetical protein